MTADKSKLTLRIKSEYNEKLKKEAKEKEISVNTLLISLVEEFIEKQKEKNRF